MAVWNSDLYLKYESERTQPARDLISRIRLFDPLTVIDLGCGPGNSTILLKVAFLGAEITGIDTSDEMLDRAKRSFDGISFIKKDVRDIEGTYDLIFSNACLQWIPDHRSLFPFLMSRLSDRGVLAFQMPMNEDEPLFRVIAETVREPKWGFDNASLEVSSVLKPEEYFDILSECTSSFDMWQTKYCHHMLDPESLVEWVKGTRLRSYLEALNEDKRKEFESVILERVSSEYGRTEDGHILLMFNRFFATAVK